ncbi:TPR repeat-containing protein [Rippkaea orientalis PCC 8801]|uniref:TPR repeat-containing protein n=1 Tax=Rippkaea orientalis (strain PCC 8801 / RF-1) TaxID=41431 RepID=B7JUS0_RIPO1|nr:CHAT domain-containing protein [Rippkaea orientalis]ACK65614.1 TPR repeat-containing protein [Rippkaea orientalis PCC 8801]
MRNTDFYLSIFVTSLMLCQPVQAMGETEPLLLSQETPVEATNSYRMMAEKAQAEAAELNKQNAPLLTKVLPKYEEALKYWRLAGDRKQEAKSLSPIMLLYHARGDYRKSSDYAQQYLSMVESLDDPEAKALALGLIAMNYKSLGDYAKVIDYLQQSISSSNHPGAISGALGNMAQSYQNLGQTEQAIQTYYQALAFWKGQDNLIEQAETLQAVAFFYFTLGEIKKSIDILTQANSLDPEFKRERSILDSIYSALPIFSCSDQFALLKQPPKLEISQHLSTPSEAVDSPKRTNNTIENFQQKVEKYRQREVLRGEAEFLSMLGGLEYHRIGEYQKAIEVYQQELKLRKIMGDKPDEAEALVNIADILNKQGKKQDAINFLNQALEIQRQLKTLPKEAETLLTLGDVYLSLGAYESSLESYQKALSIFNKIGDRSNAINAFQSIGSVYKELKNYPEALKFYQQALSLSKSTGNCHYEASSQYTISRTYLDLGDYQNAIKVGNEALQLSEKLGIIEYKFARQAKVNDTLAKIELKQNNYPKALELAQKAKNLGKQSGSGDLEAHFLTTIAETYEASKQPEQAIQTYQEQLTLYRTLGLQPEQSQTLYNLAKLERTQGSLLNALNSINEAINIIETIRKDVASPELRTSFFATKQDYYELKINLLMELHQKDPTKGYDAQAFDTSERSRARTLLELLNEANADIKQGVDLNLLEQEKSLQYKLAALDKNWVELLNKNPTEQQKQDLQQQRKSLFSQYQDIQAQIRAKSPKYAALTQPQPLTLTQVQQQVLDENSVLLQYSLGEERSYLWVVTKGQLNSYELPPKKSIELLAKDLRDAILYDKDNPEIIAQSSAKLSEVILAPATQNLTKKRLIIVADGILNYIPFSVLSVSNQSLISQYKLSNLPSSSSIAIIRQETKTRKPAPKTLAILADPIFSLNDERVKSPQTSPSRQNNTDLSVIALKSSVRALGDDNTLPRLPGTRTEAQAILPLFPESQRISAFDSQANIAFASNPQLSQYRFVHFATHGIFNSESPELSGVVLSLVDAKGNSVNGFLRLNEIFNLNLPVELVILSACETGLGKEVKGEGLVGLTRGFMYAGSPRVLVSLWKVDDQATAEMMTRFYRLMLQKKMSPVDALREAQLQMQQETEWKSPYYWGAFLVQGEWR